MQRKPGISTLESSAGFQLKATAAVNNVKFRGILWYMNLSTRGKQKYPRGTIDVEKKLQIGPEL